MYQRKYVKPTKYSKRRINKRKAVMLFSALALIMALFVGITTAFLITSDGPIINTFNPSQVSGEVNEVFENDLKTEVTIANTGNIEAYIRVAIVVTWKDAENGNVYGVAPVSGKDYTIEFNQTDWIKGSDGYYYYIYPVAPKAQNGVTTALIKKCTVIQENTPAGYGLNVEILGSAIQSVPISVVNDMWPAVTVSESHGNLSSKKSD